MKKILTVFLASIIMVCITLFFACNNQTIYTITFIRQGDHPPIVLRFNKDTLQFEDGQSVPENSISNIIGYRYDWDRDVTDFSDVNSDIVINEVPKAMQYTLYFFDEYASQPSMTVTYGQPYTLPYPARDNFVLKSAVLNEVITIPVSGTWEVNAGGKIVSNWAPNLEDFYTLTFNFTSTSTTTTVYLNKSTLELYDAKAKKVELPEINEHAGYTRYWAKENSSLEINLQDELSKITENQTFTEISTPKTFTITYVLNGGKFIDSSPLTQSVTYGEAYSLKIPEKENMFFLGYSSTISIPLIGTWTYLENVTLSATYSSENYV